MFHRCYCTKVCFVCNTQWWRVIKYIYSCSVLEYSFGVFHYIHLTAVVTFQNKISKTYNKLIKYNVKL